MQKKDAEPFLREHGLRPDDININEIVESFTSEMSKGLEGRDSSLRMIPTYIEADNNFHVDTPVVAIDAGGTNFRAALVKVNKHGTIEITDEVNNKMPGLEREISKEEFFQTIARYIKDITEKTDRICSCFFYPTEIFPDKDGRLIHFYKEVKDEEDVKNCLTIVNCILERAAILVAGNLAAVVLKTNKGKTKERPILVTVEGSTYYRLRNMRSLIDKYFREYLSGERERYVELIL